MSTLRRVSGGFLIFGGTALAIASCAQDARDFTPVDGEGGEGGQVPGVGGSGQTGGSSSTGGAGNGDGGNSSTGGDGSGGDGTGGDGSGGEPSTCTDELPSGDECGGTCDPCPDGLACDSADDCVGDVCTDGGECCTSADEGELCEGKCGTLDNCGVDVTCATCVGEATCGSENVCECDERPCAIFTTSFGDVNNQQIIGMAVDGGGNLFLTGNFTGTLQFGNTTLTSYADSSTDIFLAKFDPMGVPLWASAFGGPSDHNSRGVAVDGAGNVILLGYSYGSINFGGNDLPNQMVIAKFNGAGTHQFSESYGPGNIDPSAVTTDMATGEIIVVGAFYDDLDFGPLSTISSTGTYGYNDTFMVRFSAAGVPQSAKRVGANYDEYAESAAVVGSYTYVTGWFKDVLDFGNPNPTPLTSTGWSDMFVAKLGKSTFSHVWSKRFGDAGPDDYAVDTPRLIVDPPSGDVVVGGNFTGTMEFTPTLTTAEYEMYLARLTSDNGSSVWAKQFAGAELGAMTLGPNGNFFVAGRATGDVNFGGGNRPWSGTDDVFIARFAGNGDHIYSRVFESPTGIQNAEAVAATQAGEVWIGARFQGQLEFGTGPLQTQGGYDIAIGKYAP